MTDLKEHLQCFVDAYNLAIMLKAHKGIVVYDYYYKCWLNEPDRFEHDLRLMFTVMHN